MSADVDELDYDGILAEHRIPVESRAEPVARATRRILARNLGVTASRLVYEVMQDRLAVARAAVGSLTIARDEARAEVERLTALQAQREEGAARVKAGTATAIEQLIQDRSTAERERDEAREDRDSAEATIARLQAEVARLTGELAAAREPVLPGGWPVLRLVEIGDLDGANTGARLEGTIGAVRGLARMLGHSVAIAPTVDAHLVYERLARLQDDVVELTQAGDLHRKEGDEARAHLCELLPLARPWSDSSRARIDAAREYLEAIDREGPRAPGVLAEVKAERARQDATWGEQNHPDTVHTTRISHGISASDVYRLCLRARPSWALILLEEVSEAVEAIGDVTALRAELVQVAAVACAWVEAIDRRQGGTP